MGQLLHARNASVASTTNKGETPAQLLKCEIREGGHAEDADRIVRMREFAAWLGNSPTPEPPAVPWMSANERVSEWTTDGEGATTAVLQAMAANGAAAHTEGDGGSVDPPTGSIAGKGGAATGGKNGTVAAGGSGTKQEGGTGYGGEAAVQPYTYTLHPSPCTQNPES